MASDLLHILSGRSGSSVLPCIAMLALNSGAVLEWWECIVTKISDNFIHRDLLSPAQPPSPGRGGNITVNLLDMKYGLSLRCVWNEMVSI